MIGATVPGCDLLRFAPSTATSSAAVALSVQNMAAVSPGGIAPSPGCAEKPPSGRTSSHRLTSRLSGASADARVWTACDGGAAKARSRGAASSSSNAATLPLNRATGFNLPDARYACGTRAHAFRAINPSVIS